jgi:hypothetical protein
MDIVPNQLNIIINTSIPGYQKIKYTPSMTIKNISRDDQTVRFDPLMKLNKSIIDKIPEDIRQKQFFNKGLFESLLNYTNGTRAKNLNQAIHYGYIDNNIKVTLQSIFPDNSIIYIANKPYVIADVQWSNGNWKVDTKQKKEEIDTSKITDPYLYSTIVKEDIISGEEQLDNLPSSVLYGSNFTGARDIGRGVKPPEPPEPPGPPGPEPPGPGPGPGPGPEPSGPGPGPGPPPKPPVEPIEDYKLVPSNNSTRILRQYFQATNFYKLINFLYQYLAPAVKLQIVNLLRTTTTINIVTTTNVSQAAYNETVKGVSVAAATANGDCFFLAVADAINYYNFTNQDDRIQSGIYGTGKNLFTQLYLRTLVYEYVVNEWDLDNYLKNIAPVNAKEMNDEFARRLAGYPPVPGISNEDYKTLAESVYKSNDNFLVEMLPSVPKNTDPKYTAPFTVINNKKKIKDYILGKAYWANQVAIYALCWKLKINIIPITRQTHSTTGDLISIPYIHFTDDSWDKYLFLYWSNNHYELITFDSNQIIPSANKKSRIVTSKTSIFERKSDKYPPLYIIFLIFGRYLRYDDADKAIFSVLPEFMKQFNDALIRIYDAKKSDPTNAEINKFITYLSLYFPNIKHPGPPTGPTGPPTGPPKTSKTIIGGYQPTPRYNPYPQYNPQPRYNPYPQYNPTPRYNPYPQYNPQPRYNPYPQYNPQPRYNPYPFLAKNMVKRDYEHDNSKLAYYITIDMELHPGTSITPQEQKVLKCRQKWNSVRKAYADFVGKPYIIPPVYQNKTLKKVENTTNKTQKKRIAQNNNNSRKYRPAQNLVRVKRSVKNR